MYRESLEYIGMRSPVVSLDLHGRGGFLVVLNGQWHGVRTLWGQLPSHTQIKPSRDSVTNTTIQI